jgi:hypothetical protein
MPAAEHRKCHALPQPALAPKPLKIPEFCAKAAA